MTAIIRIIVVIGVVVFGLATHAHAAYEGQIVDAETKEPIAGVVVLMQWTQGHIDQGHTFGDAFEVRTDEQGRFSLPRYWSWNLWKTITTENLITIFKSGYEPIVGSSWEAMLKNEWGAPKGSIVWKKENGRPVISLNKALPDLEKRRSSARRVGGGIPDDKMPLLQQEIDKEDALLHPKMR